MSELGRLVTELQVHGVRVDPVKGNPGRRGGAGPSDHRALDFDGTTVMVPVYNDASAASPYKLASSGAVLAIEGSEQQCSPCLLYTSPSPRDVSRSRMPSSA